jgi:hypothetical protein
MRRTLDIEPKHFKLTLPQCAVVSVEPHVQCGVPASRFFVDACGGIALSNASNQNEGDNA